MTKHQSNNNPNEQKRQEREAADRMSDSKKSDQKDHTGNKEKTAKSEKAAKNDGRNGTVLGEINRDVGKDKK